MQNILTTTRIKMALVLLLTFFSVKMVAPSLFIANTPRVNPLFMANIINTPREFASRFKFNETNKTNVTPLRPTGYAGQAPTPEVAQVAVAQIPQVITPPPNVIFKYVSKGVSAAEDVKTGNKFLKVDAGTKYRVVGEIVIDGKSYPKIEFVE